MATFWHPQGYFGDPVSMRAFLGGESPAGSWNWQGAWSWERAPFNGRVLFHCSVDSVAWLFKSLAPSADRLRVYYGALAVTSYLAFVATGLTLRRLLESLGFDRPMAMAGVMLWLALPAVHGAYVYPIDTKEDFLAYAIFFQGLESLVRGRRNQVLVLGLLGAATRETLLVLPALYLITAVGPRWHRLSSVAVALAVRAAIEFLIVSKGYPAIEQGLFFNVREPGPALLGAFFVFGFLWPFALEGLAPRAFRRAALDLWRRNALGTRNGLSGQDFQRLFVVAFCLVLPAHVLLGRLQESRISLLLAPWAIALALSGWKQLRVPVRERWKAGRAPLALATAVCAMELAHLGRPLREAANFALGQFASQSWWLEIYLQVVLLVWIAALCRDRPVPT